MILGPESQAAVQNFLTQESVRVPQKYKDSASLVVWVMVVAGLHFVVALVEA